MLYIIIWIILLIIIAVNSYIIYLAFQVDSKEEEIILAFRNRNSLIPALYEISKDIIVKEEDVFKKLMELRNIENMNFSSQINLLNFLKLESEIKNEIDLVFKVSEKHKKLYVTGNFLYLKDLFEEKIDNIGKTLNEYKSKAKAFNKILFIKNFTVFGLFIPIKKKIEL